MTHTQEPSYSGGMHYETSVDGKHIRVKAGKMDIADICQFGDGRWYVVVNGGFVGPMGRLEAAKRHVMNSLWAARKRYFELMDWSSKR